MRGSSTSKSTLLAAAMLLAVGTLQALAGPGLAEARSAPASGSLRVSDTAILPGAPLTFTGTLPPRRSRTVKLQTFRAGRWTVLATRQSSRRGSFRFRTDGPTGTGDHRFRVLAPRASIGGKVFARVVTPTRTVTVVALRGASAGYQHRCVVGSNHRAWCWGDNTFGELGDGEHVDFVGKHSEAPSRVVGTGWTSVRAGGASTCGLKQDQSAWCWGDLTTYGLADPGQAGTPQQMPGEWRQVSMGAEHACGVHTDESAWCWGSNSDGQLGTPGPSSGLTPVQVPGSWRQVVAGAGFEEGTTCGIKRNRSAWCWGQGTDGQLGNDDVSSSTTPVEVAGDHEWASLAVGTTHTCGITTDGLAWCWGANTHGQLADGTYATRDVPTQVTIPGTWQSVSAGMQDTCGVLSDGTGWCWGWNDSGQLGDGTYETVYFPAPVPNQLPGRWTSLGAGYFGSAGTRASGSAWAWGANEHGELGDAGPTYSNVPVEVDVLR